MVIYYHLSKYISHRLSGLDFIACLRSLGHTVLTGPERPAGADIAILHDDPLNFPAVFARFPELHSLRAIAFSVWENEILAGPYIEPLGLVKEIWTPSSFSARAMRRHFPCVRILPHVVQRHVPTPADLDFAHKAVRGEEKAYRFFAIVDAVNPRKNVNVLLAAFAALRRGLRRDMRLIVKQYRMDMDFSGIPGVISISGELSPGQVAALHIMADAYVSAHHAEGWGLGLSEAMAYGKPVIATGYSGNMDFMDAGNSLPVAYRMAPVSEEMCDLVPLFSRDMQWADIDPEALIRTMQRAVLGRLPETLPREAARITERFGPKAVAERMRELLAASLPGGV